MRASTPRPSSIGANRGQLLNEDDLTLFRKEYFGRTHLLTRDGTYYRIVPRRKRHILHEEGQEEEVHSISTASLGCDLYVIVLFVA